MMTKEKDSQELVQQKLESKVKSMFTVIAIQPQNIYKKILNQCNDKILERDTCNFLNAYYVVQKHSLFECKTSITIKLIA
jgi:hypothetical protein